MTRTIKINPHYPEPDHIAEAASMIQAGGLVAFPTETVYGLGANGLDARAVQRIFQAKDRPASDPLILHIACLSDLQQVTPVFDDALGRIVQKLADAFWPGALTLVLPRAESVPFEVTAGGQTVAVRVPAHAVARALIAATGVPIAAPSANLFSRPSPTSATDVLEDLNDRIDIVLDGGSVTIGVESSVLDLTTDVPILLRPGGISLEAIQAVLGQVCLPDQAQRIRAIGETAPAPGMLLKHYSPRARLILLMNAQKDNSDELQTALRVQAQIVIAQGQKLGLLLCDENVAPMKDIQAERVFLGSNTNLEQIAQNLFAGMRALDRAGVDAILTHGYYSIGLGRAVNDRLYRAAEGRIIHV